MLTLPPPRLVGKLRPPPLVASPQKPMYPPAGAYGGGYAPLTTSCILGGGFAHSNSPSMDSFLCAPILAVTAASSIPVYSMTNISKLHQSSDSNFKDKEKSPVLPEQFCLLPEMMNIFLFQRKRRKKGNHTESKQARAEQSKRKR